MENSYELAGRFRAVIFDGTWIANTNFKHQLDGLDWKSAAAKMQDLNTIAALAQHIHYYICGINSVFMGGTLDIKDQFSFDFAPMESQMQWDDFLSRLWDDSEKFASSVEKMPDEKLDDVFADPKYGSYRRNVEAMIEHSYYHLGQIVLIKKLLNQF